MKYRSNINKGSLKVKLFLLALLPSLSIALVLSTVLTQSRISDYDELSLERGGISSQQLASLAQFPLRDGKVEQLQMLARATLEEKGVRAVSIYDSKGREIIHAGPNMQSFSQTVLNATANKRFTTKSISFKTDENMRFIAPIFKYSLINDIDLDQPVSVADNTTPIGWAEVEYTDSAFTIRVYQTLLISAAVTAITLLTCLFLALFINQRTLVSFKKLNEGLHRMKQGDLDSHIELKDEGELSTLARNINDMADSVKTSFNEMQHNVEQTTFDLKETLETIEVQNIELDLARKEAIEASRIKSEFLANTSHEIRTPLNGIIGFTNLLLRSPLSTQQADYLATIQQSSEGLLTIINDILDFSKIEAGKLVLDHVPINLRDIIEDTLNMLAPVAQDKHLELVLLIYPDVPIDLIGDPLRIKQVITNLVSNAIKFTAQGGIVIRVSQEGSNEKQANVIVSVSDTGIGLSPQQQRDIFSAFTQANTSTSREFGGTGLGLVISKRLVEQMGGDIGLESEQGKGSTFWFSLKAKQSEHKPDPQPEKLNGKRIGVIEINPVLQLSLRSQIDRFGATPITISADSLSPNDYTTLLQEELDAIIFGIPSGQESDFFSRLIIETPSNINIPFVILSPNSQWAVKHKLPQSMRAITITKPVPQKKLFDELYKLIYQPSIAPQERAEPLIGTNKLDYCPHILAVDDNAANLKLITVLLTDMGAKVSQATSGLQALKAVNQQEFDLIFMDIQMPEMDGVTATKKIRLLPDPICNTPIVALTAHALSEEREKLLSSGLNDHITKPIHEHQLKEVIQRWCKNHIDDANISYGSRQQNNAALKPLPYTSTDQKEGETPLESQQKPTGNETLTRQPSLAIVPSGEQSHVNVKDSIKLDRPVDITACIKLAGNKPALAKDMLSMLIENLENDSKHIARALEEKDYDELLNHVHKLHGATCYTGVPRLKTVTYDYETAIKQKSFNTLAIQQQQLEKEVSAILAWQEEHDMEVIFDE